jgi:hypothetical protein
LVAASKKVKKTWMKSEKVRNDGETTPASPRQRTNQMLNGQIAEKDNLQPGPATQDLSLEVRALVSPKARVFHTGAIQKASRLQQIENIIHTCAQIAPTTITTSPPESKHNYSTLRIIQIGTCNEFLVCCFLTERWMELNE